MSKGFRISRLKTISAECILSFLRRHMFEGISDEQVLKILCRGNRNAELHWLLYNFPDFKNGGGLMSLDYQILRETRTRERGKREIDAHESSSVDFGIRLLQPTESLESMFDRTLTGDIDAMMDILIFYEHKISNIFYVTLHTRLALLNGRHLYVSLNFYDLDTIFLIGSELEGYEDLWGDHLVLSEDLIRCIDFYLTVVHAARVAALQTVLILRRHLVKDVAILIGKMIYDTRKDVNLWNI